MSLVCCEVTGPCGISSNPPVSIKALLGIWTRLEGLWELMIQSHAADSQNQLLPRSKAHWAYLLIYFSFHPSELPTRSTCSSLFSLVANSLHHCFALVVLASHSMSGTVCSAFCIISFTGAALVDNSGAYPFPKSQKFSLFSPSLALFLPSLQSPSRLLISY